MLTFNDNKAGMSGLDREKITKVIEENTSANYSQFSAKQKKRIDEKIADIKKRINSATREERQKAELSMTVMEAKLESCRDLRRDCVCIDMDAYFAAVEMRDNPKLRDIPMAVGSDAMLKFETVFLDYDADLSMMSLDEAYIDITEYVAMRTEKKTLKRRRFGGDCNCWLPQTEETDDENLQVEEDSCEKCGQLRRIYTDFVEFGLGREEVVREMRFRVEQLTGLTCSAGIAANFMLAKICSDFNKPNGQFVLKNDRISIMEFLRELPIRKVSGIGRVTEAHLQSLGIRNVGDMLLQKALFPLCFSALSQESLLRTALGLPGRPSASDPRRKSVSVERTFTPTSDFAALCAEHEEICKMLEEDVRKIGILGARTVTLKLKLSSFDVLTRSLTPSEVMTSLEDIQKYSMELLEKEKGQEIRLLGVRLSQLVFEEEKKGKTIAEFWSNRKPSETEADDDVIMMDCRPCPICGADIENRIEVMNFHVDACILKSQEKPDLICISVVKAENPKKRKASKKSRAPRSAKKVATIESFWKKV